jgi:rRNA maturation endonuclease Nob1
VKSSIGQILARINGHSMKTPSTNPEWLLKTPRSRKWMLQCAGCRRWGYRHDAPPKFFGRIYLERNFDAFKLDEKGLCEQCSNALVNSKP